MLLDFLSPFDYSDDSMEPSFFITVNVDKFASNSFDMPGVALITTKDNSIAYDVRNIFKKLKNHFKNIHTYDGGFLIDSDFTTVETVIHELNSKGILPVIVGIDLELTGKIASKSNKTICQISNQITNLTNTNAYIKCSFIGYQRHLCSLDDIYEIEENAYNSLSLGKLRSYPYQLEPSLRDIQLLHVDLNALRAADAPGVAGVLPTGLSAEELCQMMKYAGTAHQLSAVFINHELNDVGHKNEGALIAEAIWYIMEGANMKVKDHPSVSKDCSQFIVYSSTIDDDLVFFRHNQSLKWWLKSNANPQNNVYLSCSQEEYESSVGEEIPDRLIRFLHEDSTN
ncbi:MAG: hypothetical protein IPL08_09210 [Saprospiraceae bacterium]|nr:hypothetical protein [Saprospiraceae bacterium]MBK8671232.1 hypothetical protein [Saprospiraceae bacterium]